MLNLSVFSTLFCWGAWGIADKKALKYTNEHNVMMRLYALAFVWIPVSYLILNSFYPGWKLSDGVLFWTGLGSVSYLLALLAYLSAMGSSEASFVLGITAAYPLIFQFLANVFLGEKLVAERLVGAAIVAVGLVLISSSKSHSDEPVEVDPGLNADLSLSADPSLNADPNLHAQAVQKLKAVNTPRIKPKVIIALITATLTWGIYGLFDKKAVSYGAPLEVFFAKTLWDGLLFFVLLGWYHFRKFKLDWKQKKSWLYCSISETALGIGGLAYLAALSLASASYVITITGCYPLLMYLFALWILKEKFNKKRFAGILLVVVGGALVQLTAQM